MAANIIMTALDLAVIVLCAIIVKRLREGGNRN